MSVALGDALRGAQHRIDRLDARLLVQHVSGCSHADLIARPETPLSEDAVARLDALVARRAAGEPLAYLTGSADFRGREFSVSPSVLIPRPETELLVEAALEKIAGIAAPRLLDLGTGSGIVAVSLALERPDAAVTAVDVSPEALAVARGNAERLGARVDFRPGDWFSPVAGQRYHAVVANPPYVAAGDPHLKLNGLPFEPALALTDGGDGLSCLAAIAAGAPAHLEPGGWLLVEHGHDQGHAIRNFLTANGFEAVFTQPDLAGMDRVSGGQFQ